MAGERGLRASLPPMICAVLTLALLLVACGGPDGSAGPQDPTTAGQSAGARSSPGARSSAGEVGSTPASDRSAGGEGGDLARLGGADLEVAPYPVADALAAEGGDAIGSMLRALRVEPANVELTLAVAPGGDPTISDWRLPGASGEAILEAWAASGPGTWSSSTLAGLPALAGDGPDGSSAWAVAIDGRFVYIRTDDLAIAEEAAAVVGR